MAKIIRYLWPALLTFLFSIGFTIYRLELAEFDPVGLATLGTRYSQGEASGSEGYDGQFTYYVATDPENVDARLDVPAYRYQRALLPFAARFIASGNPDAIPWVILALNTLALTLGTLGLSVLLVGFDRWSGYALIFGLWVGVLGSATLFMHEPIAYAFVILGAILTVRNHDIWAVIAFTAALFAKETTLTFWAAGLIAAILARRRDTLAGYALGGSLFFLWQLWLWSRFGQPGLGSGGAMATGFEWLPFMGLLRIAQVDMIVFGLFALLFVPTIVVPSIWALAVTLREFIETKMGDFAAFSLFINGSLMLILPFSTFREPFGLVRIATGLILAIIVFAGARDLNRPLNFGLFWITLLVLLVQS